MASGEIDRGDIVPMGFARGIGGGSDGAVVRERVGDLDFALSRAEVLALVGVLGRGEVSGAISFPLLEDWCRFGNPAGDASVSGLEGAPKMVPLYSVATGTFDCWRGFVRSWRLPLQLLPLLTLSPLPPTVASRRLGGAAAPDRPTEWGCPFRLLGTTKCFKDFSCEAVGT